MGSGGLFLWIRDDILTAALPNTDRWERVFFFWITDDIPEVARPTLVGGGGPATFKQGRNSAWLVLTVSGRGFHYSGTQMASCPLFVLTRKVVLLWITDDVLAMARPNTGIG